MPFTQLKFLEFRNIASGEIPVHAEQVFFIGDNGQGKTNVLEAVYLLCYGSSFRTKKDEHLVRTGATQSSVWGFYQDEQGYERKIQVRFDQGKKEIRVDDKTLMDRRELMDIVPCVVFCHEDLDFVKGAPEFQRQFINQTAALVYPGYVGELRTYSKALKTRNLLVKDKNLDLLGPYDQHLAATGIQITVAREKMVDTFNQTFSPLVGRINSDLENMRIEYRPSWSARSMDEILAHLLRKRDLDLRLGTTGSGPHRDKFIFTKDGQDFIPQASTGQMRLLSLILRLCQANLVTIMTGRKPILLLDDVLLELDPEKRKKFIDELPPSEQYFFTFLPGADLESLQNRQTRILEVSGGCYHEKSF